MRELLADLTVQSRKARGLTPDEIEWVSPAASWSEFSPCAPVFFESLVSAHLYFARCASERERCASSRVPLAISPFLRFFAIFRDFFAIFRSRFARARYARARSRIAHREKYRCAK